MKLLIRIVLGVVIAIAVLVSVLFVGVLFAGRGDWDYDLVGGYQLVHLNADQIVLVYPNDFQTSGSNVIIGGYIADFCMNQKYIGIKSFPTGAFARDEELESEYRRWYLVDVSAGECYGPYENEAEFAEKCAEVGTGDMGEWRSTRELGMKL